LSFSSWANPCWIEGTPELIHTIVEGLETRTPAESRLRQQMTRVHEEAVLTHLLRSTQRLGVRDVVPTGDLDTTLGRVVPAIYSMS